MRGFTTLLMRLVDHLQGQKDKRTCRICNYRAKNERELNSHIQKEHGHK
jgi:hypothetical protein